MRGSGENATRGTRLLLAVAAPLEARAVVRGVTGVDGPDPEVAWRAVPLNESVDLIVTGVGKANAAGGVARVFDPGVHRWVLSVGVGGVLPGRRDVRLCDVVLASESVFADEGATTPDAFLSIARMGFPPGQGTDLPGGMSIPPDPALAGMLRALSDHEAPVATVSTCSGRNRAAHEIARRTGAAVEAMEGAAAGLAACRVAGGVKRPPFAEIRVVSNTTGSRARQRWDLAGAMSRLSDLASRFSDVH